MYSAVASAATVALARVAAVRATEAATGFGGGGAVASAAALALARVAAVRATEAATATKVAHASHLPHGPAIQ